MFTRYAIYYLPQAGTGLSDFGASWLGWDVTTGQPVDHPEVSGLPMPVSDITATPRKYGFHATLKPPFRLAEGQTAEALQNFAEAFCKSTPPAEASGLSLSALGHFMALTPEGDNSAINGLAAKIVEAFEPYRAPLSEADLARRRKAGLSAAQEALLLQWGYPYVMEEFHFHMTLSGALDADTLPQAHGVLAPLVNPLCPKPFAIDGLGLIGEAEDGQFHLIHRYALTG